MLNRIDNKKELIIYFSIFVLIYLLYHSSFTTLNQPGFIKPVIKFELNGLLFAILKDIFIIIPYFVFVFILIMVIYHFARLVKNNRLRLYLRILSLLILIVGSILLGFQIIQPSVNSNSALTSTSSSTTTTTTATTNTTTTTTSSNISITSSLPNNTRTNLPPNVFKLVIPGFIYQIINIFSIFIILLVLLFFIRSFKTNRLTGLKKISKQSQTHKVVVISDANRKSIINEYLKLSNELESRGISEDYSLTPMEFRNETILNLNINQIHKVTFYYELARFSNEPISKEDFLEFQTLVNEIYAKLLKINREG